LGGALAAGRAVAEDADVEAARDLRPGDVDDMAEEAPTGARKTCRMRSGEPRLVAFEWREKAARCRLGSAFKTTAP
jgi:hypothetical protein